MSAPTTDRHEFPHGVSDGTVDCLIGDHKVPKGARFLVVAETGAPDNGGQRLRSCEGCARLVASGALGDL